MHVNLLQAVTLGHFQKAEEMLDVGMHAAIGQKAHEMQGAVMIQRVLHGVLQGLFFEENAVLNVLGDLHQHLVNHAARADVGVSHLGIAHLTIGQAHVQAGSADAGIGIFRLQRVDIGRALGENGVGFHIIVADAETIQNQKRSGAHQKFTT